MTDVWMLTKSGKHVDLLDPQPEQITIEDIAWALAGKPRYNGHTVHKIRYNIAHHSCLVYDRIAAEFPNCWTTRMWALLHDAPEAYLPDVHTLLKHYLVGFGDLESKFDAAIADRFSLPPMPRSAIKHVDRRLMATERRDVMIKDEEPWGQHIDNVQPYGFIISPWDTTTAYREFLFRYGETVKLMP